MALSRTAVFAGGAGALALSRGRPKLYRRRWHENRRADCEIAARAGGFVFGLNAFLQFLKGPIPDGLAGQFQSLFQSHYVLAIGACCRDVASTVLLIFSRYVGARERGVPSSPRCLS